MYEHPFTIKEVAWLLSIRCLDGGSAQEFPVECPYCGDTRGKCSFCVSKNGEMKNAVRILRTAFSAFSDSREVFRHPYVWAQGRPLRDSRLQSAP